MDLGTRRKMAEKAVAGHGDLKKAYEWTLTGKQLVQLGEVMLLPAEDAEIITEEAVTAFQFEVLQCLCTDFDRMMGLRNAIWYIHTGDGQRVWRV